jgi:hypothetical protein
MNSGEIALSMSFGCHRYKNAISFNAEPYSNNVYNDKNTCISNISIKWFIGRASKLQALNPVVY